jgi:hypothetical protein
MKGNCMQRNTTVAKSPRTAPARLLEAIYTAPDPYESQHGYDKFTHVDLTRMSLVDLQRESRKIRLRLDLEDVSTPWLLERFEMVRQAIACHRGQRSQGPTERVKQPSPWQPAPGISLAVRRLDLAEDYPRD